MTSAAISLVKKVIPRQGIIKFKQLQTLFSELGLRAWVVSKWTSSLYYTLISREFWREQHAVISGKLKYYENLKQEKDSDFLLRRNIHRLEKGLIMNPRRDTFATSYIESTVTSYEKALRASKRESVTNGELQWAHDVLKQYFSVVGSHPAIDGARAKFSALETVCSEKPHIPYKRDLSNPAPVNYDQFLELSYRRRSVRWYLQKPVPRELIDQ
ncbi:MAG: hypothetical protein LDL41_22680, partial [Coleofasciculus sp. S288]|nr:hypothetical protein [Coleofasciculus sp. S288]